MHACCLAVVLPDVGCNPEVCTGHLHDVVPWRVIFEDAKYNWRVDLTNYIVPNSRCGVVLQQKKGPRGAAHRARGSAPLGPQSAQNVERAKPRKGDQPASRKSIFCGVGEPRRARRFRGWVIPSPADSVGRPVCVQRACTALPSGLMSVWLY